MLTTIKNIIRSVAIAAVLLIVCFVVIVLVSSGVGLLLHGLNP